MLGKYRANLSKTPLTRPIAAAEAYPPPTTRRSVEHFESHVNTVIFRSKTRREKVQDWTKETGDAMIIAVQPCSWNPNVHL
jgi:hypothetical protein